jgi:uncharacterized Fe-S center protein
LAARVYFIQASLRDGEDTISEKARRLFQAGGFATCFRKDDFTAVKVHVGEDVNNTYIKAPCLQGLVEELRKLQTKPFVTDTSTLYTGRRHNAIDHTILATERGFSVAGLGIPFLAPDGLFGTAETPVRIDGELEKEVSIASDIVRCQSILSVAHFTGHVATCAGATLKTLGMGCSSRKGKMRQHSALKPKVKKGTCTRCGECHRHCPAGAITLDKVQAHIHQDQCLGCAECVAVCRFGAVQYDWQRDSTLLQKSVVEHALGVLKGKEGRAVFFNFLLSMTKDCDCFDKANMSTIVPDLGIVASTDPVAVDKAAIDMVETRGGKGLPELIGHGRLAWRHQIEHAVKIGLGRADYECLEVS